ncbi:MAG TPA: hypothetical protein VJT73_08835 [Polyangiaceae bacterium]|nr:hypothetical protein [Polyangiaceae bacterium]
MRAPAWLLLTSLSFGPAAYANGRFPNASQIVAEPGNPSHLVARSTLGILVSRDDGAHWSWICESAIAQKPLIDPPIATTADGSILVATETGVFRGQGGGCAWARAAGAVRDREVVDLTVDALAPARVYAIYRTLSAEGGSAAAVAVSSDNGATFTNTGPVIDDFFALTIEVAPSSSAVLYASGTNATSDEQLFFRSDDGGTTWKRKTIGGVGTPYIGGVDPLAADVAYVRTDDAESALLVTTDGGDHFRSIFSSNQRLVGFAVSPNGRQIAVGSLGDGIVLLEKPEGDAGAWAADRVRPFSTECFAWTPAGFYACSLEQMDGFAIGYAADARQPVVPLLKLPELVPLTCADKPLDCAASWCDVSRQIGVDAGCTADAGLEGAADAAPALEAAPDTSPLNTAPSSGCGCRVGASPRVRPSSMALLGAVSLLLSRARRAAPSTNEEREIHGARVASRSSRVSPRFAVRCREASSERKRGRARWRLGRDRRR